MGRLYSDATARNKNFPGHSATQQRFVQNFDNETPKQPLYKIRKNPGKASLGYRLIARKPPVVFN